MRALINLIAITTFCHSFKPAHSYERNGSYIIDATRNYTDPLVLGWREATPLGRTYSIQYPLKDSRYYNCSRWFRESAGAAGLCTPQSMREIRVYIPAAYKDGDEAAVLFGGDDDNRNSTGCVGCFNETPTAGQPGFAMLRIMLDRLIGATGEQTMPVTILINTNNADGRNTEMQTVSGHHAEFLQYEVLRRVKADPQIRADGFRNLRFTSHPKGRALLGCSSGGAQAMIAGFFRPDIIGIVLAFSATLVQESGPNMSSHTRYPLGSAELWAGQRLIATGPKRDLRVFHSVSEHDMGTRSPVYSTEPWMEQARWAAAGMKGHQFPNGVDKPPNGCAAGQAAGMPCNTTGNKTDPVTGAYGWCNPYDNWAFANNRTQEDLQARGYASRFVYTRNACHCDPRLYYQELPNILAWGFAEFNGTRSV